MGKLCNFLSYQEGETGDLDSMPCASELLHGVETRSKRLIEMNGEDELMIQQSKNKSLLISSFDTSRRPIELENRRIKT